MAKKPTSSVALSATPADSVILSEKDRKALSGSIIESLDELGSSSTLVTRACELAHKLANGHPLAVETVNAVCADIRANREAAYKVRGQEPVESSIKPEVSRWRKVLKVYSTLPQTVAMFTAAPGIVKCDWHQAMKLATKLVEGATPEAAAAALAKSVVDGRAPAGEKAPPKDPNKAAGKYIREMLNWKLPKPFKAALEKLADEYEIALPVK